MIFYDGQLVNYQHAKGRPEGDVAGDVYRAIEALRSEYFGKDKKGKIQLRYPAGIRKKNTRRDGTALYEPRRVFLLQLISEDGMWRWSNRLPNTNGFSYENGNRYKITDPYIFEEKDIDLVWFLMNHNPEVKAGMVYFEDPEKVAQKEAEKVFSDIDIKYVLYSSKSPLSTDKKAMRDIADVFGIKDPNTMGLWELRNALFEEVANGEKTNSKYVNLKQLELLSDNEAKLKAVSVVRKHMNMDVIKFNHTDRTWYIANNGEWITPLLKVPITEYANRDQVLLDEVLSKSAFKGKVFAELGIDNYGTKAEVRELGRPALLSMCKQEDIECSTSDKLEELVDKYCKKMGIES